MILAGDPMQLPPTILSLDKSEKKTLKETLSAKKGQSAKAPEKSHETKAVEVKSDDESSASDGSLNEDADASTKVLTPVLAKKTPLLRPPRTLETTLFDRLERMHGSRIKRMLKVQYRSAFACFY